MSYRQIISIQRLGSSRRVRKWPQLVPLVSRSVPDPSEPAAALSEPREPPINRLIDEWLSHPYRTRSMAWTLVDTLIQRATTPLKLKLVHKFLNKITPRKKGIKSHFWQQRHHTTSQKINTSKPSRYFTPPNLTLKEF